MQTVQAIFAFGSNIEPRRLYIEQACEALRQFPGILHFKASTFHETEPVAVPADEQHLLFLNAVAVCETSLTPQELSRAIHGIEASLGRQRDARYGSARTIDIDLIAVGDCLLTTRDLTLPHPRAHLRTFVLVPLAELLPDYRLPGHVQTVSSLLRSLTTDH